MRMRPRVVAIAVLILSAAGATALYNRTIYEDGFSGSGSYPIPTAT